jgi:hypothetical protein
LVYLENRVGLSRDVHVAGVACRAATRIVAGVADLMQRTGNDHTCRIFDDQTVERSGGAVCGLHLAREDNERMFLG